MTKLERYVSTKYPVNRQGDLHSDVNKVKLPSKLLQTKRVNPLVENSRQSSEAEAQRKTLRTNVVRQNLHCVRDGQARPSCTCDTVEEKDHGDDSDTSGGGFCLCVDGTASGPDTEGDEHSDTGEEEEDSASDSVDEEGGEEGD